MKRIIIAAIAAIAAMAHADSISGRLRINSSVVHSNNAAGSTITETIDNPWYWNGGDGDIGTNGAASDINYIYVAKPTLASTYTQTLDLAGSLTDSFGATLTFTKVKLIVVAPTNAAGVAGAADTITVRPAAANGATNWIAAGSSGVTVRHGGVLMLASPDATGYGVVATSGDILEIVNNSTNAAYTKIIIAGE